MVQQSVQQGGCNHRIAEDLAPFCEASVRRQDHGALFVSDVDQLEEQVGAPAGDRQISDLVDDEQRGAGIEADLFAQAPLTFSLGQRFDQFGEAATVYALASCLHCGHADGRGEMAFPGAGRAKEVQHLGPLDELELGQRLQGAGHVEADEALADAFGHGDQGRRSSGAFARRRPTAS